MIGRLLAPSGALRCILGLAFAFAAAGLFKAQQAQFLSDALVAYVAGLAGPFALLCATAIWSMRDKVDSSLDGELVDAAEFRKHRDLANKLRVRVMRRAVWVAIAALAAAGPTVAKSVEAGAELWMFVLAGLGVSEAMYGYLFADRLEQELRALRDKHMLERKRRDEQSELAARIVADGRPPASRVAGRGMFRNH